MKLIVPHLAKQYGVTEQLKAENQMEWVRQMNACKAQAEAIMALGRTCENNQRSKAFEKAKKTA